MRQVSGIPEGMALPAERDMRADHLTFSNIIGSLSYALDLTEGAHPGHAVRSCLLGIRIGMELRLSAREMSDLYYALLLKDAGCSSNASRLHQIVGGDEIRAKAFTKTNDWTRFESRQFRFLFGHVYQGEPFMKRFRAISSMVKHSRANAEELFTLRCFQGAHVVKALGLGAGVSEAIYNLDEHWDGSGYPAHRWGADIPRLAQIASLAQTLEVFHQQFGPLAAQDCMQRRKGRWFDPELVKAAGSLLRRGGLWAGLDDPDLQDDIALMEPDTVRIEASEETVDGICLAFAEVVDAKSPSTYTHSVNVARIAIGVGEWMGLDASDLTVLRRAGLLHDLGKLSVPNSILDKPGKLDAAEWESVKKHPFYTQQILARIPTFERITGIASAHHEKLDGSGYHLGIRGEHLCLSMRLLAIADIFEALTAKRSYRDSLPIDQVIRILSKEVPHALDAACFEALQQWIRKPARHQVPAVLLPSVQLGSSAQFPCESIA